MFSEEALERLNSYIPPKQESPGPGTENINNISYQEKMADMIATKVAQKLGGY